MESTIFKTEIVNGKISYIPIMASNEKNKIKLEINIDGQEG